MSRRSPLCALEEACTGMGAESPSYGAGQQVITDVPGPVTSPVFLQPFKPAYQTAVPGYSQPAMTWLAQQTVRPSSMVLPPTVSLTAGQLAIAQKLSQPWPTPEMTRVPSLLPSWLDAPAPPAGRTLQEAQRQYQEQQRTYQQAQNTAAAVAVSAVAAMPTFRPASPAPQHALTVTPQAVAPKPKPKPKPKPSVISMPPHVDSRLLDAWGETMHPSAAVRAAHQKLLEAIASVNNIVASPAKTDIDEKFVAAAMQRRLTPRMIPLYQTIHDPVASDSEKYGAAQAFVKLYQNGLVEGASLYAGLWLTGKLPSQMQQAKPSDQLPQPQTASYGGSPVVPQTSVALSPVFGRPIFNQESFQSE